MGWGEFGKAEQDPERQRGWGPVWGKVWAAGRGCGCWGRPWSQPFRATRGPDRVWWTSVPSSGSSPLTSSPVRARRTMFGEEGKSRQEKVSLL